MNRKYQVLLIMKVNIEEGQEMTIRIPDSLRDTEINIGVEIPQPEISKVTCDKCGKEIKGDFVLVRSDFYTVCEGGECYPVAFSANCDQLVFCDACYEKYVDCEED